ncbi:MAG: hypothetical protein H7Z14_05825 [Anaerolineae bacterium]|nr:hypothetical protein [Phycisphaerae bacterium]
MRNVGQADTDAIDVTLVPATGDVGVSSRALWPILLVAFAYLAKAISSDVSSLKRPFPLSPWESAITVDAWRVTQCQAIYTDPASGHATHMYGPLATYVAAPFVAAFGPDPRIPRTISFVAASALCVLLGAVFLRLYGIVIALLVTAVSFMQFFRVGQWEVDARPDAASLLFSALAMLAWYRANVALTDRDAIRWTLIGSLCMVLGIFFKQQAIALAIVPFVVQLLPRDHPPRWRVALIPIAAAVLTVLCVRLISPWMFFYMFRVPASYSVAWPDWLIAIMEVMRVDALFVLALVGWAIVLQVRASRIETADAFLLVTIVIAVLFGAALRAKLGGNFNSLLPATLAMTVFAARVLPAIANRTPVFVAIIAPLLLLSDIVGVRRTFDPSMTARHGDRQYDRVIARVKALPGTVVTPDDPTIALRAKGYAGRSGECELDANGRVLTDHALNEIRWPDWVVQVRASRAPTLSDETLARFGFEKATRGIPAGSVYVLWKRSN